MARTVAGMSPARLHQRAEPAASRPVGLGRGGVPRVTPAFWLLAVLVTDVAESVADGLDDGMRMGITYTWFLMSGLFVVALAVQLGIRRYVPAVFWSTLGLGGVVGTLMTDELVIVLHAPVGMVIALLTLMLAVGLLAWHSVQGTLSWEQVLGRRSQTCFWVVLVVVVALSAAVEDVLVDERAGWTGRVAISTGAVLVLAALASSRHRELLWVTWTGLVLIRPCGESVQALVTLDPAHGGLLGLGQPTASLVELVLAAAMVGAMTLTGADRPTATALTREAVT